MYSSFSGLIFGEIIIILKLPRPLENHENNQDDLRTGLNVAFLSTCEFLEGNTVCERNVFSRQLILDSVSCLLVQKHGPCVCLFYFSKLFSDEEVSCIFSIIQKL